jgi:hypothetical protein
VSKKRNIKRPLTEKQLNASVELKIPRGLSIDELCKNKVERLNEKNWNAQLRTARPLVETHLHGQVEIAVCAMRACEVLEHRRKKYKTEFTPKKFAESIGLEPKTLYEWIAVTRNVVLRLPKDTYSPDLYPIAYRTHRKVTLENTPQEVVEAFEQERGKGPYAYYLDQLIKSNRSGFRFIRQRAKELPEPELRHLRIYVKHMAVFLDAVLGDKKTEKLPEKTQTNRTTLAFNYTRNKSYDGDSLEKRRGRGAAVEYLDSKKDDGRFLTWGSYGNDEIQK